MQVLRRPAGKKRVKDPTANAAVEAQFETYNSNDVFPSWRGKSATNSREAIPVELSISPDNANRSADSYDIDVGEIMSQRKA